MRILQLKRLAKMGLPSLDKVHAALVKGKAVVQIADLELAVRGSIRALDG
jgi:hypothetical protein